MAKSVIHIDKNEFQMNFKWISKTVNYEPHSYVRKDDEFNEKATNNQSN